MLPAVFKAALQKDRQQQVEAGLIRKRRVRGPGHLPRITTSTGPSINFCSNDYLGLSAHPALIEAANEATALYGVGSGASQLVSGMIDLQEELEESLARFTGRDRALIFSSGYLANLAIITSLADRHDLLLGDRLNHASLIDAAQSSRARFKRYRHGDAGQLERFLSEQPGGKTLVVTDAVFSMDGDIAPLGSIASLCQAYQALLVVDDAHGFGVLGENGAGTLSELNLDQSEVPVMMATFAKAMGGYGAFVAGDAAIIESLLQTARTLIYTTALPPAMVAAASKALELLEREHWRRAHLNKLIQHFISGAMALGIPLLPSTTPIQPVKIGRPTAACNISDYLLTKGYWVTAIRPPTVPPGTSRLRVSLSAAHEIDEVDNLLGQLKTALKMEGIL